MSGQYIGGFAQTALNPFELTARLPEPVAVLADTSLQSSDIAPAGNPFDIVVSKTPVISKKEKNSSIPKPEPEKPAYTFTDKADNAFLFPVILIILLLLTIFLTLFRSYVSRINKAIFSDNMLHQLYSDRLNIGMTMAFIPLYILFLMNAGLFLFLTANHFHILPEGNRYLWLLYITAGLTAWFILKHLALIFLALVFPIDKEISSYNFTIIIFSIFLGLVLTPFNLCIAYMSPVMTRGLIFTTLILIASIYILRSLRGFFIADKYLLFHKFHFLLYICTVEITPVLFLYRFLMDQLQG